MTLPARPDRDGQRRSAFTQILERFVGSCVGCLAAILVDEEGEAVDHAGVLPAYEAKLAAAHWQIVLRHFVEGSQQRGSSAGEPRSLTVHACARGYLAYRVFGDYVLVVVCMPTMLPALSARALSQVETELRREAGWPEPANGNDSWSRVRVRCDRRGFPQFVSLDGSRYDPLEVLGRDDRVGAFERGYLAAHRDGRRVAIVREPSGFWYARDAGV